MPYSIELYFEPQFEKEISKLWDKLENAGLPVKFSALNIRPHLTLAVLQDCDELEASKTADSIRRRFSRFAVDFPAICVLLGASQIVFLLPIVSRNLGLIREELLSQLLDSNNLPLKHYMKHSWLPHCTISKELTSEQSKETLGICQDSDIFGTTEAVELGFVEFGPRRDIFIGELSFE